MLTSIDLANLSKLDDIANIISGSEPGGSTGETVAQIAGQQVPFVAPSNDEWTQQFVKSLREQLNKRNNDRSNRFESGLSPRQQETLDRIHKRYMARTGEEHKQFSVAWRTDADGIRSKVEFLMQRYTIIDAIGVLDNDQPYGFYVGFRRAIANNPEYVPTADSVSRMLANPFNVKALDRKNEKKAFATGDLVTFRKSASDLKRANRIGNNVQNGYRSWRRRHTMVTLATMLAEVSVERVLAMHGDPRDITERITVMEELTRELSFDAKALDEAVIELAAKADRGETVPLIVSEVEPFLPYSEARGCHLYKVIVPSGETKGVAIVVEERYLRKLR